MYKWDNAGVEPTAEKQSTGYAAGEKLPAGHMNWLMHTVLSNLNTNNSAIEHIQKNIPEYIEFGVVVGDGTSEQQVDIGFRPACVIMSAASKSNAGGLDSGYGHIAIDGYLAMTNNSMRIEINDNGFAYYSYNKAGANHYYIAFSHYTKE